MSSSYPGLLPGGYRPAKRKVFISYHHGGDQPYYDAFAKTFSDGYEIFSDNSPERAYNSDSSDYVRWAIAQNDITGSSCTIVLCGANTHQRKYVDWEIKYTLDRKHGLIGLWLPTLPLLADNGTQKPDRLQDNIGSGYAAWLKWGTITPDLLKTTIEASVAANNALIKNGRPMRQRNG